LKKKRKWKRFQDKAQMTRPFPENSVTVFSLLEKRGSFEELHSCILSHDGFSSLSSISSKELLQKVSIHQRCFLHEILSPRISLAVCRDKVVYIDLLRPY